MSERTYLNSDDLRGLIRGAVEDNVPQPEMDDVAVVQLFTPSIKAVGGDDSLTLEFIISDGSVDREQDTIAVEGWDFTDYRKNPVVLFGHNHWEPPIGRSRSVYVEGNVVKSIAEFTPEDLNPLGYMTYRMYKAGFMHAVSVGFKPIEYTYAEDRKWGINFIKQALLEYSAVPVPANPNALLQARSAGINVRPLKGWAEQALDRLGRKSSANAEEHSKLDALRQAVDLSKSFTLGGIIDVIDDAMSTEKEDPSPVPPDPEQPPASDDPDAGIVVTDPPPTDPTPAPAATEPEKDADGIVVQEEVKRTFLCGVDGCSGHGTRDEAVICRSADEAITSTLEMIDVFKAGRVLSAANEARLRTAQQQLTEVLNQLSAQTEEDAEDDDKAVVVTDEKSLEESPVVLIEAASERDAQAKDAGAVLHASEADLRAAFADVVSEAVRDITGRVD